MTITEMRKRYDAALQRARDLETRISDADEPAAEDQASLDAALSEAGDLRTQIQTANTRASTLAELQAFAGQPDWQAPPIMPHTDPNNTRNGRLVYSYLRAIQGQLDAIHGRGGLSGIELETHQELLKLRGRAANGILVPLDAPIQYRGEIQHRDLSTATGVGAIPNPVDATRMIDILRPRMVLPALGATVISDMRGPFSLPKTTATVTPGHVTVEGTNVAKSNPTIGDVDFTYKSIEASTKLTRQFINSASISAESYVIDQLTKTVAATVENEAFNGPGSTKRVKGLFAYTALDGINVLALGANGAAPTWAQIVSMTGMIDTANAPTDARNWLLNPTLVAYFQSLPKVAAHPVYVLGDSNTIAGYNYQSTSQVPNNLTKGTGQDLSAMAFGAWSEMMVALFTGIDLYIDPFSAQPHVNVTAAIDYDVQIAHLESFAICLDVLTS